MQIRIDNVRTQITRQARARIRRAFVVLKSHAQCGVLKFYFVYYSLLERPFAI